MKRKKVYLQSGGREVTLISPESYFKIRQVQLKQLDSQRSVLGPQNPIGKERKRLKNAYLDPKKKPGLNLKYPIFLGENGEMIAIMEAEKYVLGSGASGVVFLGMDIDTGKQVAVKYQSVKSKKKGKAERVEERKEKTEKVMKEITNLEELGRLVSSTEFKDDIIVVDELAWGNNYAKIIESLEDQTDLDTIVLKTDMIAKFLEEVNAIHQKGFLHRDVKLDNMIWDKERNTAKIVDFGTTIKGTHFRGGLVGSPSYLAPEVLKGDYSRATDVYACGVAILRTLYPYHYRAILKELNEKNEKEESINAAVFFREIDSKLFESFPPEVIPILEEMLMMINPEPQKRPSLLTSIGLIKSINHQLEYNQFIKNHVKSGSAFSITSGHLENPLIKKYLLEASENNDEFLDRINPISFYLILRHAAKTENKKIFDNLAYRFDLFKPENAGFTQNILKGANPQFREYLKSTFKPSASTQHKPPPVLHRQSKTSSSTNADSQKQQDLNKESKKPFKKKTHK